MSVIIDKSTLTLTTTRRVDNFSIMTPPNKDPYITVVFGETITDNNNNIINYKSQTEVLTIKKDWLTENLPIFSLPSYKVMYNGLGNLLHSFWSGQHPQDIIVKK